MNIQDICIQGDPQRGADIIKFFEVMGVQGSHGYECNDPDLWYGIDEDDSLTTWCNGRTLIRLQPNSLLPESWCVRTPCETVLNWINNNLEPHEDGQREYYSVGDGWFGSLDGRRWCDNHAWAIDLTESQFLALSGYKPEQKEQREIIGYKCPMDLYGGSFKKGEIWIKRDALTYQPFDNPVGVYLPAEIVELWEPVYKEEKKPLYCAADGKPLFKGEECYRVSAGFELSTFVGERPSDFYDEGGAKYFSTKEAAEQYIIRKNPVLCFEDIEAAAELQPESWSAFLSTIHNYIQAKLKP